MDAIFRLKQAKEAAHHWKVLFLLALATIAILAWNGAVARAPSEHLFILMANAYALVALAAMLNRSSTRNSWVYHGVVLLASSVASYWVFKSVHELVSAVGVTYILFVAYIAATAWGNFTGSRASIFLEKILGVQAKWKKSGEPPPEEERRVKIALLVILGIFAVAALIATRSDYVAAIFVLGLNFLNTGIHTFVRRARNVGNTWWHNGGLLFQGLNFFFLFRFLAAEDMSWVFFLPFAVGGVLGGLFAHTFTMLAEDRIKADPDSHLISRGPQGASRFSLDPSLFPWRLMLGLFVAAALFVFIAEAMVLAVTIIGLAIAQYIAFTLISRARTRKNRTYEVYASMASNGTWLGSFGKLDQHAWGMTLFPPYIIGVMIGGNIGIGVAMHIERWFNISSD